MTIVNAIEKYGIVLMVIMLVMLLCFLTGLLHFIKLRLYAARYKRRIKRGRAFRHAASKSLQLYSTITAMIPIMLIGYIVIDISQDSTTDNETLDLADSRAELYEQQDLEKMLEDHKADLSLLKSEEYSCLSVDDRLQAGQVLLNVILTWLGCKEKCKLTTEVLPEWELGYYRNKDHVVVVSKALLISDIDSEKKIYKVILHEAFHHYQYEVVRKIKRNDKDVMMPYGVLQWDKELNGEYVSYDPYAVDSRKSYEDYYNLYVEASARCFQEQWCDFIFDYIEKNEGSNNL